MRALKKISAQNPKTTRNPTPTEGRVTTLEGAISPTTRGNKGDENNSPDGLRNIHGQTLEHEEVMMHSNGMIPTRRWKVTGPIDDTVSGGHSLSEMHPMVTLMWIFPQEHLAAMISYTNDAMCRITATKI